jgi:hypothetical protein
MNNRIIKSFLCVWMLLVGVSGIALDRGYLSFLLILYLFHISLIFLFVKISEKLLLSDNAKGVVIAGISGTFVVMLSIVFQ